MSTEVKAFSASAFREEIRNKFCSPAQLTHDKTVTYVIDYVQELVRVHSTHATPTGKLSMLVESDYVDMDFADDYASFYSKCFQEYGRYCKRVHFFSLPETEIDLKALASGTKLTDTQREGLELHYLGFVVARPLPQTIIGRTVLRTYCEKYPQRPDYKRHYKAVMPYRTNICGAELVIGESGARPTGNSLAYQRQDKVVAACASVALWSCLDKAAELYGTATCSPAAITRMASTSIVNTRVFPSQGLKVEQICEAIRQTGLEPEVITLDERVPLASLMRGYLELGQPVLLGMEVEGRRTLHAVAVAGYSIGRSQLPFSETFERMPPAVTIAPEAMHPIYMPGRRIEKFYAHDDQIGPFSRLLCTENVSRQIAWKERDNMLMFKGDPDSKGWYKPDGAPAELYPKFAIIPIYHKIRLKFMDVYEKIAFLHNHVFKKSQLGMEIHFEWDIRLTKSNDYKSKLKNRKFEGRALDEKIYGKGLPRFLWITTLRFKRQEDLELVFDATDFANGSPLIGVGWPSTGMRDWVRQQEPFDAQEIPEAFLEEGLESMGEFIKKASLQEQFGF